MSTVYRLIAGRTLPHEAGPVIEVEGGEHDGETYGPGVIFWCPCLKRRIVVRMPPHKTIAFDADRRLTIEASIGAHECGKPGTDSYLPPNWCHAFMTDGRFKLLNDSICPGARR